MLLDEMAKKAIEGNYYTADGQRLMLSIDDLVALFLLSPEVKANVAAEIAEFKERMAAARAAEGELDND